jgi:hypothetical protein
LLAASAAARSSRRSLGLQSGAAAQGEHIRKST